MNLNYINFNTSLGEMLPSAIGGNLKADLKENSVKGLGKDTAFAEKLMALLSPKTGQTSSLLNSNSNSKVITGVGEDLFDIGNGTSDDPVLDFINEFKNYLKMAGVVLENATIDKKGIAALEELLVAQGFSREDIKGLVADLMDEDTELTGLAELVDGLETLDLKETNLENEEEDGDSIILPISDLPFITSILTTLGIPEDFSKSLLSDVKEEGVGINLDSLIKGLQGLQKQSFLSGISYTADSQKGAVEQMFQALGFEIQKEDTTPLTLGNFVTALEQNRLSNSRYVASNEKVDVKSEDVLNLMDKSSLLVKTESVDFPKSSDSSQLSVQSKYLSVLKSTEDLPLSVKSEYLSVLKSTEDLPLAVKLEPLDVSKPLDNLPLYNKLETLKFFNSLNHSQLSDTPEIVHQAGADAGIGKQSTIESRFNILLRGISQNKNQSMEPGDSFKESPLFLEKNDKTASGNFFQVKTEQKIQPPPVQQTPLPVHQALSAHQALSVQQIQGGIEPELVRLMENVEVVVKDLKNSNDDIREVGRDTKNTSTAKSSHAVAPALESSQGADGGFKDMGMGFKNQAASTATSSRSVVPSYVANQVGKSLARAVAQGDSELKLQLRPPELGRIIMTIDNLGTSLKVSVLTENQAAKDILTSHANELKAALSSSGISIASFDVDMGSDFKQSMADARQDARGSASKRSKGSSLEDGSVNGVGDSTINTLGFTSDTDGALHFVA